VTTVRQALEEGRPVEDARLLLAHVLGRDPAWLFAWPEHELDETQLARYRELLLRRAAGEPLAYLTGEKEFWSLPLKVTPATLVPRPETELLVELALNLSPLPPGDGRGVRRDVGGRDAAVKPPGMDSRRSRRTPRPSPSPPTGHDHRKVKVLDLGTGSGAIALALARERPGWQITATDASPEALAVAEENAQRLRLGNVRFLQGDWYQALPAGARFHLILSNPPYVAEDDPHLQRDGLPHEPGGALASGPEGLDDLRLIIAGAPRHLEPGGWLLVEHGMDQGEAVRELFRQAGFEGVETRQDLAGRDRVTLGCYS